VVPADVRSALQSGNALVDGINIAVAAGNRADGSGAWFYNAK
jgi:hypothetical protein